MTSIAPVLKHTIGQVHFRVDDVKPAQQRLPTKTAISCLEKYLEQPLLAFSHDATFPVI